MIRSCILFYFFLFGLQALGQKSPITFINYGKPITIGTDTLYSSRIHEIIVNPDFTFEFWSRPHVSCITWRQYKGTWKKENDTLFFSYNYEMVRNAGKEAVIRTVKAVIQNNTLLIVSGTKTKTILPDYYRDIEFEESYFLNK